MGKLNFIPSTIWIGDNLEIMRGMNTCTVDLIYLDPPFNSHRYFEAPIGSCAASTSFKDAWTLDEVKKFDLVTLRKAGHKKVVSVIEASGQAHSKGMQGYLTYMVFRLIEMHRILKDTGSIYLHVDPTASHYLKLVMDTIFGRKNFRNEIIWSHKGSWKQSKKTYTKRHNTILFYTKSDSYTFNLIYENNIKEQENYKRWEKYIIKNKILGKNMPINDTRFTDIYLKKFINKNNREPKEKDVVYQFKGSRVGTVTYIKAVDPKSKESTKYPTQKPLALLERIIKTSSNENDIVFDPFCGCATTLVAAENLQRQWLGCDLSKKAVELVDKRIRERNNQFTGCNPLEDIPKRTDLGRIPKYNDPTNKNLLYGMQDGMCAGCEMQAPKHMLAVDHKVPVKRGGTDHIDNLQLLCNSCNASKGKRTMSEWEAWKLEKQKKSSESI